MGRQKKAPATPRPHLSYVPGLDGLRALAVILVLLYHADLRWLPGGFLGVEVFFVISGYLITSLLLNEWRWRQGIDIRGFWLRRARRLLPAAYLMIVIVLAYAVLFLPQEVAGLRGDALAAIGYVTNWYLVFSGKSYFEIIGRPSMLQHLWSLAVEEQFYLLWPVLFAVGMRFRRGRRLLPCVIVGAAASALLMAGLYHPDTDPSRIYYGTDTRAAGLLIGAALALVWPPAPRTESFRGRVSWPDVAALGGLAVVLVSCLRINEYASFLYQGGMALVAVATAVTIAALVHPRAHLARRLLEWRPLRFVGLRSYALYLWHWPVFMVTRPHMDIALTGLPLFIVRLAVTVVLAELSYRFVEMPIRNGALERAWQAWRTARAGDARPLCMRWVAVACVLVAPSVLLGLSVAAAQPPPTPAYLAVQSIRTVVAEEPLATANPALTLTPPADPGTATPAPTAVATGASGAEPQGPPPAGATPGAVEPVLQNTPAAEAGPTVSPAATTVQVTAIGDSVMLGAAKEMQKVLGSLDIDAAVSRSVTAAIDILRARRDAGELGAIVVVHIGNNGPFSAGQLNELMGVLEGVQRVVLVNIKVPRRWEGPNNAMLGTEISRYPNAVLVDWNAASMQRPDLFWDDGIHLRPEGARAYTELILAGIQAP